MISCPMPPLHGIGYSVETRWLPVIIAATRTSRRKTFFFAITLQSNGALYIVIGVESDRDMPATAVRDVHTYLRALTMTRLDPAG